jgi:UDP-N-acetylmuramyl pentapeptide synthase
MQTASRCFCEDSITAKELVKPFLSSGKIVFLKGSRGMKLENLWPDENN